MSTVTEADTGVTSLLERLHRMLGPLAGGIIIDFVDFATFGPIGLVLGPILGGLAGWWVSSIYDFGTRGRIIFATLAAIYCTIPFTELLPLATLVSAIARFRERPRPELAETPVADTPGADAQAPGSEEGDSPEVYGA